MIRALLFLVLWAVAAAPLQAQDAASIASVRPELLAVPLPSFDELEPVVANQFREQQTAFTRVTTQAKVSERDLSAAYSALGRLCQAYEFFDAAEASYANALRLVPQDAASLHLLGYLYQQTGRYDEAVERYTAARRAKPNDREVQIHLAEVFLSLNRLADARDLFQQLVDVFPAVARAGLGEIALREGRFNEAVDHLGAALERAPNAGRVRYSLAMAYRGQGRLEQARAHLAKRGTAGLRAADPLVDSLTTLLRGERAQMMVGRRAYDAGQFDEARVAFNKAVEAAPSSAEARLGLGMALAQLGNGAGAIEQLEATLRLDANNVTAHTSLGMVLARSGRTADAVPHLRAAHEREPGNVELTRTLIRLLLALSRPDEAIEAFSLAGSIDAEDEDVLLALSIVLADRMRFKDALDVLDSAERQFPDRLRTATTLSRLLAASPDRTLRNGQRSLALATRVYEKDRSPVHSETMAIALAELGRCAEAATWMQRAIAEAERVKDTATAARLRGEAPRYAANSCRP
jgi:tetratricopeptide (TPR) repeat protein